MITIRPCTDADVLATAELFNQLIPTATVAWTDVLMTPEESAASLLEHRELGFPVLVAVESDAAGHEAVVGMASYGYFRNTPRFEGYRFSVEHSIHVRDDRRGAGIGRRLLEALIGEARAAGLHVMVGAIDAENQDSLRFHERMGFVEVARMPETGFKFGGWLDLVLVQRMV